MPKVSVIIPVYNVPEQYFRKCLDTVCAQTLKDIEIICVDDKSTDGSLAILKEYAAKDSRIKIIEQSENRGAAVARNIGIEAAAGEYIGFVDSDDFIDLDFYEKLHSKAVETAADVVKGIYFFISSGVQNMFLNGRVKVDKNTFSAEFASAIYRKNLLKSSNITFPLLRDMEDPIFAFLVALKSNAVKVCDEAKYYVLESEALLARRSSFSVHDKIEGMRILFNEVESAAISTKSKAFVLSLWFSTCYMYTHGKEMASFMLSQLLDFYDSLNYKDLVRAEMLKISTTACINFCREVGRRKMANKSIYFISVVQDFDLYNRLVRKNGFISNEQQIEFHAFDNSVKNIGVAERYNQFLDKYEYSKPAWFVFCHSDWEVLENVLPKIENLDKTFLWGPVGAKIGYIDTFFYNELKGTIFQECRDGSETNRLAGKVITGDEKVDTFDCQCLIAHSSLINKYKLRFDECLQWDLYVEDFCISAHIKHGIESRIVVMDCCHCSDAGFTLRLPRTYWQSKEYLDKKYKGNLFAGTCSTVGFKEGFKPMTKIELFSILKKRLVASA